MTVVEQVLVVIGALAVLVGVCILLAKIFFSLVIKRRRDIDRLDRRVNNLTKEVELMKMSDEELRTLFFGNKSFINPLRDVSFLQVVTEMKRRDVLPTEEETEKIVEEMRKEHLGDSWVWD